MNELTSKCVVRLTTSTWSDKRGVHVRKSLVYLKRQCTGFNILDHDCENIGAEEVVARIQRLYDMPDGIYAVVVCNETTDWETNMVDDYDYKLVPIK